MIDLHAHILPDLDDGSRSLIESMETLRILNDQGYDTVVCTPHISPTYPNSVHGIKKNYDELKEAILDSELNMTLLYGAEYYFESLYESIINNKQVIYINHGNESQKYILVEFPFLLKPLWLDKMLNHLSKNNIGIIIAHPERCKKIDIFKEIVQQCECIFAINGSSILGNDGSHVKNDALSIISMYAEKVVFTSDSHPALQRYPQFDKLIKYLQTKYSQVIIDYWLKKLPQMIVYKKNITNSEESIIRLYANTTQRL